MTASIFLALSFASAFPATTTFAQYASILEDHGNGFLTVAANLLPIQGVPNVGWLTTQRKTSRESSLIKKICAFAFWISPCIRASKLARP